jgi:hypothetical protein
MLVYRRRICGDLKPAILIAIASGTFLIDHAVCASWRGIMEPVVRNLRLYTRPSYRAPLLRDFGPVVFGEHVARDVARDLASPLVVDLVQDSERCIGQVWRLADASLISAIRQVDEAGLAINLRLFHFRAVL